MYGMIVDASNGYHERGLIFMAHLPGKRRDMNYEIFSNKMKELYFEAGLRSIMGAKDNEPNDSAGADMFYYMEENIDDFYDKLDRGYILYDFIKEYNSVEDFKKSYFEWIFEDYDFDRIDDEDIVEVIE